MRSPGLTQTIRFGKACIAIPPCKLFKEGAKEVYSFLVSGILREVCRFRENHQKFQEVEDTLIAGFVGSPRRGGNTGILVQKVLEGAASQGAETAISYLNELTIHGYQACNSCKEHARCRQEDDMTLLYEVLKRADGFALGSPIRGLPDCANQALPGPALCFLRPQSRMYPPPGEENRPCSTQSFHCPLPHSLCGVSELLEDSSRSRPGSPSTHRRRVPKRQRAPSAETLQGIL